MNARTTYIVRARSTRIKGLNPVCVLESAGNFRTLKAICKNKNQSFHKAAYFGMSLRLDMINLAKFRAKKFLCLQDTM